MVWCNQTGKFLGKPEGNGSAAYVKLLFDSGIQISMTESGDPLENVVAERINGILKEEYLDEHEIKSVKKAMRYLPVAIRLYNSERPHLSISKLTPDKVHHANNLCM